MKQNIKERVHALRMTFHPNYIKAFIIPSTDPHLSEYVAPHWMSREWISGFTGSAGTAVILMDKAGLWTDSRYFLQAAKELEGSGITLYKEMLPETPSITEFLCQHLKPGESVSIDGKMFSVQQVEQMKEELAAHQLQVDIFGDPLKNIWKDRPSIPDSPAFIYDIKYAGKSCEEKISAIRAELKKKGVYALFISALDEIAWTLNLRGNDVHCNPVIVSYLLITQDEVTYFISPEKVTPEVETYLKKQQIGIQKYDEVETFLNSFSGENILIDPRKTNYAIYSAINPKCSIIRGESPVTLLKAIRNKQEIAGIHAAMQRDGVALVRFLKWLEESVSTGKETELSIDKKLHEFRAAQPLYMGESFDTIAGYKEHGAIVHYSATPESDVTLQPKGFLLLDSGAQYLDGTTDITRTIALGELTEEEKTDYTLILKGHIALAMAKFPAGTRGAQLDVLARIPIWNHRMNFLHGTGHGVGHFLSVHEGPQSIRMNENPVILQPGMVTSNEPGVYKTSEFITMVMGSAIFGENLTVIVTLPSVQVPMTIISKVLLFTLVRIIFLIKRGKKYTRIGKESLLLYTLPVVTVANIILMVQLEYYAPSEESHKVLMAFVCIGLILCNIAVFFIYDKNLKKYELENQLRQAQEMQRLQASYYMQLEKSLNESRKQMHDFKNHITTLEYLHQGKENTKAVSYMQELQQQMKEQMNLASFKVKNAAFDVILYEQNKRCQELDITFEKQVLYDDLSFLSYMDTCTIFANALNNAVKTYSEIKEGKRKIE